MAHLYGLLSVYLSFSVFRIWLDRIFVRIFSPVKSVIKSDFIGTPLPLV